MARICNPEGVDGQYMPEQWRVGDRVFYAVTDEQMYVEIFKSGIITERWMARFGGVNSGGFWLWSLLSAAKKGHGEFDFAEVYLAGLLENKSFNYERNRARTNYNDGAGFFRFGNTNNIYNLYDGGNYMWGRAMSLSGFSYGEVRFGSQANELGRDSDADQRAIKNGFNGN
ncbi:MAG: hypothetical protein KGZ87_09655 [Bacteroidetes bacterium]|nr:hypothetical protein [Bacteroidota bacterium]